MRSTRAAEAVTVELGVDVEAHAFGPPEERHRAAGGDHRLRGDAVPEVRGASDDVTLDEHDLGAETCGIGGRLVAGGSAADDHESHCHCSRVPARSRGLASSGRGLGERSQRGRPWRMREHPGHAHVPPEATAPGARACLRRLSRLRRSRPCRS